jgi:hypothetical protein
MNKFFALVTTLIILAGCSKPSPYDGTWNFSIEKSLEINKDLIEKTPSNRTSIEIIGKILDVIEIKNNEFSIGVENKKVKCSIKGDEKNASFSCIGDSDIFSTKDIIKVQIVEGALHIIPPDLSPSLIYSRSGPSVALSKDAKVDATTPQGPKVEKDINDTCAENTKTVFSCLTEKGNRIEVCETPEKLNYTFGVPGNAELSLSISKSSATTKQWEGMGSNEEYSIDIPNGKTTYSVFTSANHSSHESSAGVEVFSGDKSLAVVKCGNLYFSNIEGIDLKKKSN